LEEAIRMIVVGVDVHKQSLTAVAVDEVGRSVAELTVGDGQMLLKWAASLSDERLWALEDCRQLTRQLERTLVDAGERLGGGAPKLMGAQRLHGGRAGSAASRTRSTHSRSPGPPCGSRGSITLVLVRSGCAG